MEAITEDKINDIIDEAIDSLADDNISVGADALMELAIIFARAGLTKESFMGIRKFVIDQAIERTDIIFIQEKLKTAEQKLQESRCGKITRIIH